MNATLYFLIANVFEYPQPDLGEKLGTLQSILSEAYPETHENMRKFVECMPLDNQRQCEELFTRTFDVQALTTLDVGYVLFGDDYKRGALLANLNREHLFADNDCGTELADHLPNLLRLLTKSKDDEFKVELVQYILLPALEKMIDEFNPNRVSQKRELYQKHYNTLIESSEKATVYLYALRVLETVLKKDFLVDAIREVTYPSDFIVEMDRELVLEGRS
ncbi:MAG: hypothetical protein AABZ14_00895 [Candidatus Margulisiibacteriota bacterium]